jgi:hypothetical protein
VQGFEWDTQKAAENVFKHGVSFEEAAAAFDDPAALVRDDEDHSWYENRLLLIGRSGRSVAGRLLFVVYTMRDANTRLISARPATPSEARQY